MEYRESKWEKKVLRGVPVDAIEPWIAADARSRPGLWCLVAGWPSWVPPDGAEWITMGETTIPSRFRSPAGSERSRIAFTTRGGPPARSSGPASGIRRRDRPSAETPVAEEEADLGGGRAVTGGSSPSPAQRRPRVVRRLPVPREFRYDAAVPYRLRAFGAAAMTGRGRIEVNLAASLRLPSGFLSKMLWWHEAGAEVLLLGPPPHVREMLWFRMFARQTKPCPADADAWRLAPEPAFRV